MGGLIGDGTEVISGIREGPVLSVRIGGLGGWSSSGLGVSGSICGGGSERLTGERGGVTGAGVRTGVGLIGGEAGT